MLGLRLSLRALVWEEDASSQEDGHVLEVGFLPWEEEMGVRSSLEGALAEG